FTFVTREPDGTEEEFFSYRLPKGYRPVFVWGHLETRVQQASANTFADDDVVINPNATVDETGAFRLSYPVTGAQRNVLEVAFTTQGGQPVVRKYLLPGDRPTTAPTQEYFTETVASLSTKKNLWEWY
ncbi:MAG: hypothetical protein MI919_24665, partial [Holophagales bacterium]|nr:hypothetical protein [Holophagales bacterium]